MLLYGASVAVTLLVDIVMHIPPMYLKSSLFSQIVTGALCAILMTMTIPSWLHAQTVERIAAIVNDEVISTYDVEQRMGLVLSSSNMQPTQDIIQRLQGQVVQALVDEKLQLQEATKYEVDIDEDEVNAAITRLAEQNNIRPDVLENSLKQNGINIVTLRKQIEAELAWNRVVNGLLASRVSVTEDEIDHVLNRLVTSANKPQYLVSEILLEVPNAGQEENVRQGGLQLIQQMQQGVPFSAVAQQFSSSASAAQGGDIGWIHDDELAPELSAVIQNLKPGQLSSPIRTLAGYYILALRERRVVGGADPLKSKIDVRQIMIPLTQDADADTVEEAREGVLKIGSQLNGCTNLEEAASSVGGAQASSLGRVMVSDLAGRFRSAVATLKAGQSSEPVRTEAGLHILIVCEREDTGQISSLPSREQIENRLYDQQLSMLARRHLRDLRRDATIEMR